MDTLYKTHGKISQNQKENLLKQAAKVIWFTGLSGAGKTTLSSNLENELFQLGYKTCLLDGDNIRLGLNSDLSFSDEDRTENIRRVGEVAKLFKESGIIVLCAFITPFENDRVWLRDKIGDESFIEVFVDCPVDECIKRDVKGLYKKAHEDRIKNFTGVNSRYENPVNPAIVVKTNELSVADSVVYLLNAVKGKLDLSNP